MKTIYVKSTRGNYQVVVGSGLLKKTGILIRALGVGKRVLAVFQEGLPVQFRRTIEISLAKSHFQVFCHELPSGERAKSSGELFKIIGALASHGFDRSDVLLGVGGGATGDVAGLAAALFMRGISFVNVPTTLLAQVDSSIGGKTAVNLPEGKNLAGVFWPPRLVLSDMETLLTLPERELRSAMGEVIKYGMIRKKELFVFLEKNRPAILAKAPKALEKIVYDSAWIKAQVVSRDEHETKGERMILNFGHTFGHGFEKAVGYRATLLHGEAVALGMVCAGNLAVQKGIFDSKQNKRLQALISDFGLPIDGHKLKMDASKILHAMMRDKKKKADSLRFILPERIGKVRVVESSLTQSIREILGRAVGVPQ